MYSTTKKEKGFRRTKRLLSLFLTALSLFLFLPLHAQEDVTIKNSADLDSLPPEEVEMPWEERVKIQLDKLAREAEHAYYHTGICV